MKIATIIFMIISLAIQNLGANYVYATAGPNTFDCSGFTYYCYKEIAGIELPRSAYNQGYCEEYEKIESIEELKPGDLVFFNTVSDGDLSDHAGIYLGEENNKFIHASSGKGEVVISEIHDNYYESRFSWGRRILSD